MLACLSPKMKGAEGGKKADGGGRIDEADSTSTSCFRRRKKRKEPPLFDDDEKDLWKTTTDATFVASVDLKLLEEEDVDADADADADALAPAANAHGGDTETTAGDYPSSPASAFDMGARDPSPPTMITKAFPSQKDTVIATGTTNVDIYKNSLVMGGGLVERQLFLPRVKTRLDKDEGREKKEKKEKEGVTRRWGAAGVASVWARDADAEDEDDAEDDYEDGVEGERNSSKKTTTTTKQRPYSTFSNPIFEVPGESPPASRGSADERHSRAVERRGGGDRVRDEGGGGGGEGGDAAMEKWLWRGGGDGSKSGRSRRGDIHGVRPARDPARRRDDGLVVDPPPGGGSSSAAGSSRPLRSGGDSFTRDRGDVRGAGGAGSWDASKTVPAEADRGAEATVKTWGRGASVARRDEEEEKEAHGAYRVGVRSEKKEQAVVATANDDADYERVDEKAWKEVEELALDDDESDEGDDERKERKGAEVLGIVEGEGKGEGKDGDKDEAEGEHKAAWAAEARPEAVSTSVDPSNVDLTKLSPSQRFAVTQVLKQVGALPPDSSNVPAADDDDNNSDDMTVAGPGGKGGLAEAKWRAAVAAKARSASTSVNTAANAAANAAANTAANSAVNSALSAHMLFTHLNTREMTPEEKFTMMMMDERSRSGPDRGAGSEPDSEDDYAGLESASFVGGFADRSRSRVGSMMGGRGGGKGVGVGSMMGVWNGDGGDDGVREGRGGRKGVGSMMGGLDGGSGKVVGSMMGGWNADDNGGGSTMEGLSGRAAPSFCTRPAPALIAPDRRVPPPSSHSRPTPRPTVHITPLPATVPLRPRAVAEAIKEDEEEQEGGGGQGSPHGSRAPSVFSAVGSWWDTIKSKLPSMGPLSSVGGGSVVGGFGDPPKARQRVTYSADTLSESGDARRAQNLAARLQANNAVLADKRRTRFASTDLQRPRSVHGDSSVRSGTGFARFGKKSTGSNRGGGVSSLRRGSGVSGVSGGGFNGGGSFNDGGGGDGADTVEGSDVGNRSEFGGEAASVKSWRSNAVKGGSARGGGGNGGESGSPAHAKTLWMSAASSTFRGVLPSELNTSPAPEAILKKYASKGRESVMASQDEYYDNLYSDGGGVTPRGTTRLPSSALEGPGPWRG